MRREFSVLAEGRHVFGRRPKPRAAKPREKQIKTLSGNRARKVSGTQGMFPLDYKGSQLTRYGSHCYEFFCTNVLTRSQSRCYKRDLAINYGKLRF